MQNNISSSSCVDPQQAAARRNPSGGLRSRSDKRDFPPLKSSELIANDRNCTETSCYCDSYRDGAWCRCPNFRDQVFCTLYDVVVLMCSIMNMTCSTPISCQTSVLPICRYNDAKTGNVELIPIKVKCDRIICVPGTTSPPPTPPIPTRPVTVTDAGCGGPAAKPMVLGLYEFSMSPFIT